MNSGIYKITNTINDKIYIGSSINLRQRKSRHFTDLKAGRHDNSHLQRAFKKYGAKFFQFEVIFTCPISELIRIEQIFLDNYKPEYNMLTKAYASFGYKHTLESLKKMSERFKGIRQSPHQIRNAAETRMKKVSQYDISGNLIDTFESTKIAAKATGIDATNIAYVCRNPIKKNGKPRKSAGFIWKYS